jgi:hypothetical protein
MPCGGTLQVAVRTLLGIHSTTTNQYVTRGYGTIAGIFVLHTSHLFFDFFRADVAAENGSNRQVSPVPWIDCSHHVLRIKHLLSQFRNIDMAELLRSLGNQGSESDHEEVQTGERDHINGKFSKIRVQLTGETKTGGNARHDQRNEMIEISVGRGLESESTKANIVQSLVVNTKSLVRVFNELLIVRKSIERGVREPRELHCKVQRLYQTLWERERQRRLPSCDRDTPHGFC